MAGTYDGSIKIDTKIDSTGIETGTKKIVSQITSGVSNISQSLKGLAAAVGVAFGVAAVVNFGKASIKAATELSNAMVGLQSIMEGQGRSFNQAQKFINDYVSDGLIPATQAISAYKNLALRGYDTSQIEDVLSALKDSAAYGRQASYTLGQAVESATEGLKNENSVLVDNAGVTKNVAKMWEDYAKSIGTTANNLTKQQKIQAEVLGVMEETRFQIGDAAKIASSYSGQLLRLEYSFNNLKIAVGNALIPIAQAVLPSINAMIQGFTRLANTVAQVTSLLFGKTVKSQDTTAATAEAAAGAEQKLADATTAAGKAAKQALAGFDELNVLQAETASGSASADGITANSLPDELTSGGELFGNVTVSPAVQAAVDTFIGLLSQIDDWYNTNLRPNFEHAGEEISAQLSNIKENLSRMWRDIVSLGNPLKSWFTGDFTTYLQTLVETWGGIFSGFLESANMVFSNLWDDLIYPFFSKFVTIGLPMITQFHTKITETLGVFFQVVKGMFDTLWKEGVAPALQSISKIWGDMMDSLAAAWKKWGAPIFSDINEAVENIGEVFQTVWSNVIKPVWDKITDNADWLWSKHFKPLWDNILDFVGEFADFALKIYNDFVVPLIKWFSEKLGPAITGVFDAIIDMLSNLIAAAADALDGVITSMKGILEFMEGIFTADWEKIMEGLKNIFKGAWDALSGIAKGAINTITGMINGMIHAVVSAINAVIGKINTLSFTVPDIVPGLGGRTFGFNIPVISDYYQIPRLATGAVIPPNAEFLAVLGDQKHGTNIEAPLDTIVAAVRAALESSDIGGDINVTMPVYLDSEKIYEGQQRVKRRRGTSLVTGGAT